MANPNSLELNIVSPPQSLKKPRQIHYALWLLWISFAQITLSILLTMPQFSADEGSSTADLLLLVMLITLAVLIPCLSRGYSWARICMVIFTIINISIDLNNISAILHASPFWMMSDLIGDITLIAATYLIVVKPGSVWFSVRR